MYKDDFRLYIHDPVTMFQTAIVDNYVSLIWTDRYDECGDFELHMIYSPENRRMLKLGSFCHTNYSDRWAVIEKIEIEKDSDSAAELIATGRSLECILERRIIVESTEFGNDNTKVNVQESIKQLLDEAFIEPEDENRAVSNFIFLPSEDPDVTELEFEDKFNGEDLLSAISDICGDQKIGFRIIVSDDFQFIFQLFKGKDRSYQQNDYDYVVFSPYYDNLLSSMFFTSSENFRNTMYVNKTDSDYVLVSLYSENFVTGIERREISVNVSELQKNQNGSLSDRKITVKGRKLLKKEHTYTTCLEGDIVPDNIYVYGKDYYVGDIVQFQDAFGNKKALRVKEFIISNDSDGFQMTPGFEDPEEDEDE